jgi:hypothetical protein
VLAGHFDSLECWTHFHGYVAGLAAMGEDVGLIEMDDYLDLTLQPWYPMMVG